MSHKVNSSNIQILWVDDDLTHDEDAKNMVYASGAKRFSITVIHPTEFENQFEKIKNNNIDLFLVDYCLNEIPLNGETYDGLGLELAGKIKGNLPDYPVYVVSCREEDDGVFGSEAQPANDSFDKVLTYEQVQNSGLMLYWDAKYYNIIRNTPSNDLEALLDLIKPPQNVKDRLKQAIPESLRAGLYTKKDGNPNRFGKWVRNVLIDLPGFLYDDIRSATHLGMSKEYFLNNESKFKNARYHGVFSESNKKLWWVTELNKIVYSSPKISKLKFTNTWEIAPLIYNVPNEELSRCIFCNERYPEIVGINVNDKNEMAPVHYRCSEPYSLSKRELFFDEVRGYDLSKR